MYQLEYPWLLVLLPLPLLIWWLLPPHRETSASVRLPFFSQIAAAAGITPSMGSAIARRTWLQILAESLAWLLIVAALARPQFIEPPLQKVEPQRDLMLALDLSQSMETKDFHAPNGDLTSRVSAVRKVASDFVARRTTDRVGLIAFGDAPYPLVPFTMDHALVQSMIEEALPGIAGPRTSLGDAIGLAIKMFEKSSVPEKLLIVLTDGTDTASKMPPAKAADIAHRNNIVVDTVAIGDPNATGEDKLDIDTLQKIAEKTGGRYFFGQNQGELEAIYATLDRITPVDQNVRRWQPRIELFHYPMGGAVAILLGYHLLGGLGRAARKQVAP
ncbi:vWA domain-containing protein [Rhizobium tubonense]|uniref:VWFA domain-containing protein n=1 Tax=Rhizobium tubonense TaxID=484088 RepID=A0A2W4CDK4_9HYPH|nr:VWA domain-containing protein [Rhizobium tubonense]PZM11222.1 hypothetical protein CPY51_20900 [Rhizobium tubonense]